jgi:hypothetical protein
MRLQRDYTALYRPIQRTVIFILAAVITWILTVSNDIIAG